MTHLKLNFFLFRFIDWDMNIYRYNANGLLED